MIYYDLHIHSALSPCAEDIMTPANICGYAKLLGLDMIAIADHNAIDNVQAAIRAGVHFGVTVVPAFELQTEEDIHILCYFESYKELKTFYDSIEFTDIQNREDIFGKQLVIDEEDKIVSIEKRMLLTASKMRVADVYNIVRHYGGAAVPAHIDREGNSMLATLGTITPEFLTVEVSKIADKCFVDRYLGTHKVLCSSDAHTLEEISGKSLSLQNCSPKGLIEYINTPK